MEILSSKRLLMIVGLVLFTGIGHAASAADQPKRKNLSICFAYQTLETQFWVAGHKAIVGSLNNKGIKVLERNAGEDANKQIEQVRDCISQNVDGIIIIPQDGESVIKMIGDANRAEIPVAIFNRPPNPHNPNKAIVVVADNTKIAEKTTAHLADEAKKLDLDRKVQPLIMVGALADTNAIGRRKGFLKVINDNPDLFAKPVEVPTEWDADVALSNLESALQSHPNVDLIFTSSDFLLPQIRAVLAQRGKWRPKGMDGHVILGSLDGDKGACKMLKQGVLDADGVQDLFFEAHATVTSLLKAIDNGETMPDKKIDDTGFALTQDNLKEREMDMWGCKLLNSEN